MSSPHRAQPSRSYRFSRRLQSHSLTGLLHRYYLFPPVQSTSSLVCSIQDRCRMIASRSSGRADSRAGSRAPVRQLRCSYAGPSTCEYTIFTHTPPTSDFLHPCRFPIIPSIFLHTHMTPRRRSPRGRICIYR